MSPMILNMRDLTIADARITMLKSRCDYLRRRIANPGEAASARAEVERMEKRIGELREQIIYYRELVSNSPRSNQDSSFYENIGQDFCLSEIPQLLIKRRICLRLTQAQLAKAAGASRQMIARYERTRYAAVSLKRISHIDAILRLLKE
jgi:hypothetical protein